MDTKDILETMKIIREYEILEVEDIKSLVPFASDQDSCYICVDMSAQNGGIKGQVVALDCDYQTCTKLADSMEKFFEFALEMHKRGKCTVTEREGSEPFFVFESEHLFNHLEDVLSEYYGEDETDVKVELPKEFWQEEFGASKISASKLAKKKSLHITKDETQKASLAPLSYMTGLQELVLYGCTITDFEAISGAVELKKVVLVQCEFDYDKLKELVNLPKLKSLTLKWLPISDISELSKSKSLKILTLIGLDELEAASLNSFSKLQELELDEVKLDNFDFLDYYKGLKKLVFENMTVPNLEFLQNLKKLKYFRLYNRAADESGLRLLKELEQLTEFYYPVSDMKTYVGCEKLERIAVDAIHFKHPEALKDSKVKYATVYSALSMKQAEEVLEMIEEYVTLYSSGMEGDFIDIDE